MEENKANEISELDVMLACCGVDEDGVPNANVAIKFSNVNMETLEEEVVDEMIIDTAVVNMHRNPKFTMVDLVFQKSSDWPFVNAVGRLQKMVETTNLKPLDSEVLPTLVVTVAPYKFIDEYFCTGMHGIWCVMPSFADGPNNTLRFIFTNDCFGVYDVEHMADIYEDYGESYYEQRENNN